MAINPRAIGRAIGPNELRGPNLPAKVYDVWNELIEVKYHRGEAEITLAEAYDALIEAGFERYQIKDGHYLDITEAYIDRGWSVDYVQPAADEKFKPYFVFKGKCKSADTK